MTFSSDSQNQLHLKANKGFSLMEVMLVVAIMSIIGLGMASLMSGQASETRGLNQSLAKLET